MRIGHVANSGRCQRVGVTKLSDFAKAMKPQKTLLDNQE